MPPVCPHATPLNPTTRLICGFRATCHIERGDWCADIGPATGRREGCPHPVAACGAEQDVSPVRAARELLHGTISAVGLAAGDRIVVGAWHRSPIGAFADVMWAEPDGTRLLLARDERTADYVAGIYLFDRIEVVRLEWTATPSTLSLHAGQLQVDLAASGGRRVSVPRPWWFTRWVEGPIARRLMGVDVHGTSPLGVEEWYQARAWRWIHDGQVRIAGEDQGPLGPPRPPLRVGFSEPPPRPSITDVAVRLRRPPLMAHGRGHDRGRARRRG